MKALTVLQPWAQLLILGVKRYDVRSWKTKHRGPLLIHAGRVFPDSTRALCGLQPYRDILAEGGIKRPSDLPRGALIGTIYLEDCLPTDQVFYPFLDNRELALGDFRSGYWAWKMTDPKPFPVSIPSQGQLGIFDVADDFFPLVNACAYG